MIHVFYLSFSAIFFQQLSAKKKKAASQNAEEDDDGLAMDVFFFFCATMQNARHASTQTSTFVILPRVLRRERAMPDAAKCASEGRWRGGALACPRVGLSERALQTLQFRRNPRER